MPALAPFRLGLTRAPSVSGEASAPPRLRTFTVEDYHRLAEVGVLAPDARTELVDGLILDMAPFSPPHIAVVNRLTTLLVRLVGDRGWVSVQNALRLDDRSEPEPDLVVLRADTPEDRVPEAEDALLVVEVAVTTEPFDRNVKVPRYAAAGVPEVWLVLPGIRAVEVYRALGPEGYAETVQVSEGVTVPFLGREVAVASLFPPLA